MANLVYKRVLKGGRRPAVTGKTIADVRAAYLDGQTIAALAREHGVSRGAVRTAVADLMPEHVAAGEGTPAPELPVSLDMPGKLADFLRATEPEPAERAAPDHGVTVRRGQGYTLRVTAAPTVHRQLCDYLQAQALTPDSSRGFITDVTKTPHLGPRESRKRIR